MTTEMSELNASWHASHKRAGYWIAFMVPLGLCMSSVAFYNASLPVSDSTLILPWVVCFVLSLVGQRVPVKEYEAISRKQDELNTKMMDEFYKTLTGETKR